MAWLDTPLASAVLLTFAKTGQGWDWARIHNPRYDKLARLQHANSVTKGSKPSSESFSQGNRQKQGANGGSAGRNRPSSNARSLNYTSADAVTGRRRTSAIIASSPKAENGKQAANIHRATSAASAGVSMYRKPEALATMPI